MDRRTFLATSAATAVVAAMPLPVAAAPIAKSPAPAWLAGSPGEFDWIHATGSEHEARLKWLNSYHGVVDCEKGGETPRPDCECDFCSNYHGIETQRAENLDGISNPTAGDWLRAGMGFHCSRCSNETYPEEDGHAVGDEAVCEECMTLADWDKVDPDRAAEMRADLEDEN